MQGTVCSSSHAALAYMAAKRGKSGVACALAAVYLETGCGGVAGCLGRSLCQAALSSAALFLHLPQASMQVAHLSASRVHLRHGPSAEARLTRSRP